ncbi:MAG TPA: hypothetical protein VHV82_11050 [Sporichthyaceae bacterium]|nr:hypothetical protein [Sporichthyaceae bacterium]
MRMLRAYGKARAGEALAERERLALVRFLRKLDAENAVLAYDPEDHDEPFKLVDRLADDTGYVRRHTTA